MRTELHATNCGRFDYKAASRACTCGQRPKRRRKRKQRPPSDTAPLIDGYMYTHLDAIAREPH